MRTWQSCVCARYRLVGLRSLWSASIIKAPPRGYLLSAERGFRSLSRWQEPIRRHYYGNEDEKYLESIHAGLCRELCVDALCRVISLARNVCYYAMNFEKHCVKVLRVNSLQSATANIFNSRTHSFELAQSAYKHFPKARERLSYIHVFVRA